MKNNFSLTIAIPAYNEQDFIVHAVKSADTEAKKLTSRYEILVVNDGSTDATGTLLKDLTTVVPSLRVITHPQNQGIEASLKDLYKSTHNDLTFFNGADNEIHMSILPELYKKLEEGYDIVVAKRIIKYYSVFRTVLSWGFNFFTKLLFGFDPYDAGCAKLFKTPIYKEISVHSTSVFGEAERLIRAARKGYKITSVPVTHYPKSGPSSIKATHAILALKDLLMLMIKP